MKIYDEAISAVLGLIPGEKSRKMELECLDWPDAGKQNLVLRGEMAYELGAGNMPGLHFLGVTSSECLAPEDQVVLIGQDLPEINRDGPYARITLLRVRDELFDEGESVYDAMGRFVRTRYSVNPKGFMNRISTERNHEPVRVSRAGLEAGLNFAKVGRMFLEEYKHHKEVVTAQVIFVTLPEFDYGKLMELSEKTDQITKALDHVLRDVKMDCSTCKLQPLCDEVEGMKELHFTSAKLR